MRRDLEKRPQASLTWNTCTVTPSLLAKKPSGGFHIVITFARVGWCCKLHPLLMLAKRRLHPLHYCFMEVHNQVRSHVCLLPDTSIQGCHEVLWCCHPISQHQSVHKISHVNAWLRDCCRNIIVSSWAASSRRDVQQSLLTTFKQLQSMSVCLKSTNILGGIFSQGVFSASPHLIAVLTSCPPIESVMGLPFFIGIYKVFSRVVPYSAPTPIQPTLDCDWWFSN